MIQTYPKIHSRVRPSRLLALWLLLSVVLITRAPIPAESATFVVTTTANSGPGSLRQAILDANVTPVTDTISFAIGASGTPRIIQPTTALPTTTGNLIMGKCLSE